MYEETNNRLRSLLKVTQLVNIKVKIQNLADWFQNPKSWKHILDHKSSNMTYCEWTKKCRLTIKKQMRKGLGLKKAILIN